MTDQDNRQTALYEDDSAFDRALMQALARVEAEPPVFLIPHELTIPQALARSIRQVNEALEISRSALRLAFNLL
ncbi:MAG: hypothetical protein ACOX6O_09150 [Christensenellales bacterium]|jgi:hypothetical protein